jgi:hypothetical protein
MAESKAAKAKRLAKARRNRFKGINLVSTVEGYVQTGIWTEALFHANPFEVVTGRTYGDDGPIYNPGSDGGDVITLPEILGFRGGGHSGQIGGDYGTYAPDAITAVARNLSGGINTTLADTNWMSASWGLLMPAVTTAAVTVGFKWGKKLTSKPRARVNKFLKDQLKIGDLVRI